MNRHYFFLGVNHNYGLFTYNTIARSVIDMNMEIVQQHNGKINIILHDQQKEQQCKETTHKQHHEQLHYIDDQFATFIGLDHVKEIMREIYALKLMNGQRDEYGMRKNKQVLHMMFMGNPGTGKTTIARQLATVLYELNILSKGHFIEAERADIVGEYIGQTAQKTRTLIQKAQGGVLFIDEAYSLGRGGHKDFGREAIDTIVKQMEDYHEDFLLILAGYPGEMEQFLHLNPGLRSRFAYHVSFSDYNLAELMRITKQLITERDYELTDAAEREIRVHIQEVLYHKPLHFSNARYVRNIIEKAIRKQAMRLLSTYDVTPKDLKQITRADISLE